MARNESTWSDEHVGRVKALEERLGRAVCGAVTPSGDPCSAPPGAAGRCARHDPARRPSSPSVLRAWILTAVSVALALAAVGAVLHFRRDPAEDLWQKAARLLAEGRAAEARPLLQVIAARHADSPRAEEARALLGQAAGNLPGGTPAERLFRQAQIFYPLGSGSRSDLEMAAERYLAVADSWPQDPLARDALFEAGQCYDHLGRADDAVKAWRRFLDRYPVDGRTPEVLYALGYLCYNSSGRPDEGRAYYEELIRRFPNTSSAEAARVALGRAGGESGAPPREGPPSILTEPGRL